MNRRDLVAALAERTDTDKRSADAALQAFIDTVTETVATGEPVMISGFLKFARVDRPARMGRNPATGEAIKIKASRRARVTPLKGFKDAVLVGQKGSGQEGSGQEGRRRQGSREEDGRQEGGREEDRRQEGSGEEGHRSAVARPSYWNNVVRRVSAICQAPSSPRV